MKLVYIIVSLAFSIIINTTTVASTPREIFLNDLGDIENGQSRLLKVPSDTHVLIEKYKARNLDFKSRSADDGIYFDYILGNQSQPYGDKSQGIAIGGEDTRDGNPVKKYLKLTPYENEFTNTVMRDKPIEVNDNDILRMNKPIDAGNKEILIDVSGKICRKNWVMSTTDSIWISSCVDDSLIKSICVTPNSDGEPCVLTMNMDFEHDIYHFKFYNIMTVGVNLSLNREILFELQDMSPFRAFEY